MTNEELREMHRELVHDLGDAARNAQAQLAANHALDWARAPDWRHKPSDDFDGCTE